MIFYELYYTIESFIIKSPKLYQNGYTKSIIINVLLMINFSLITVKARRQSRGIMPEANLPNVAAVLALTVS